MNSRRRRYHLQDREMSFCSGRHMCNATTRFPFEAEHVSTMIHRIFEDASSFTMVTMNLRPARPPLHHVGGHSPVYKWSGPKRADGWCLPPMPRTTTKTWRRCARILWS